MVQQYNKQLSNKPRSQSLLGDTVPVSSITPSRLIMAEVISVNYLYNTVELQSIKNHEMLVKSQSSNGQFSAKLPVTFGGTYSNGKTYGETVPINVGDQVLVGFLDEDITAPVVLGVYKDSSVSYELAPTNLVSGSPDADEKNRKYTMENLVLFPSQTYDWVSGNGDRESTFQGRSFVKLSTGLFGSMRPNDYGYDYNDLERIHLRGRDIEPEEPELPQILFQHNSTFATSKTNVLFDDDSTFAISKIKNDETDSHRSEFRLEDEAHAAVRVQANDKKHNDEAIYFEVGADAETAYLSAGEHKLSLDESGKLLLDGRPVGAGESGEDFDKINATLTKLSKEIAELDGKLDDFNSEKFTALKNEVDTLYDDVLTTSSQFNGIVDNYRLVMSQYNSLKDTVDNNKAAIEKFTVTLSNAAGDSVSLGDRLDKIESRASAIEKITDEVVNARKDNATGATYDTVGLRLDNISGHVKDLLEETADIATMRETVSSLSKAFESLETLVNDINNKLATLIGGQDVNTTYILTVTTDKPTVIRQGSGATITLGVRVLRNGLDITPVIKPEDIAWTRVSGDTNADATWNSNNPNKTGRTLTVTEADITNSARFRASLTNITEPGVTVFYGEIEVTVLIDKPTITTVLIPSVDTNQIYNSITDRYTPDYTTSPISLKLNAYLPGTTTDVTSDLTNVKWYYNDKGSLIEITSSTVGFTANGLTLKVGTNTPLDPGYRMISVFATYTERVTGKQAVVNADIKITTTQTVSAGLTLDLYSIGGEIIIDKIPEKVTIIGDVYQNGEVINDSRKFKLFAQDPTVSDTSNAGYDKDGGLGWRKITNKSDGYSLSVDFDVAATSSIGISIKPEAVVNIQNYKLLVYTDKQSDLRYFTVRNMDSPMVVSIVTKTGLLLSGNTTKTDLTASVFSRGAEVDKSGSDYVYKWYAYLEDGTEMPKFGGGDLPYRLGKTISVARGEIQGKALTVLAQVESK